MFYAVFRMSALWIGLMKVLKAVRMKSSTTVSLFFDMQIGGWKAPDCDYVIETRLQW